MSTHVPMQQSATMSSSFQAYDIEKAYLQHTTFTAKVMVNYDSACRQFFTDSRAQDCGRLVLNKRARQQLERVRASTIQINRVELEVGTAFRTLSEY